MGNEKTKFSFEILPPLKGNSIYNVYDIIDRLREFDPVGINITSHHSEHVYREQPDGSLRRVSIRKRPGTVAIAAAIQNRYGIPAVPHVICRGFTKEETEYALLDLNFLGITNLFLLRGDAKSEDTKNQSPLICNEHATDLQKQVNMFNRGIGVDGLEIHGIDTPFRYGMACYPEKHEESPDLESDIHFLKEKVANGADYLVTQMFFDNSKYFRFVERCRHEGINVPIIPGLKPITRKEQQTLLPRIFSCEMPRPLAAELSKAADDEAAKQIGIEWAIMQCRELMNAGVPCLHFYTLMASKSVKAIAREIF